MREVPPEIDPDDPGKLEQLAWPILAIEEDFMESFSRYDWDRSSSHSSAPSWGPSARFIDSRGAEFRVENRVVEKGRFLWVIPCGAVTNVFIPTDSTLSPEAFKKRVVTQLQRYEPDRVEPFLAFVRDEPPDEVIPIAMQFLMDEP